MRPDGRTLLRESSHALLLVRKSERRVKDPALESQSLLPHAYDSKRQSSAHTQECLVDEQTCSDNSEAALTVSLAMATTGRLNDAILFPISTATSSS